MAQPKKLIVSAFALVAMTLGGCTSFLNFMNTPVPAPTQDNYAQDSMCALAKQYSQAAAGPTRTDCTINGNQAQCATQPSPPPVPVAGCPQ